jgi:uncharacterized RDD family membrane protein YckC
MRMTESGEAAIAMGRPSIASPSARRGATVRVATSRTERADFGQRLGALLFDMLIFMIVLMLATFLLSSFSQKSIVGSNLMLAAFYSVAGVLYVLNFVLLAGREGQTIGKRLVGIRVVTVDGEPVGYGTVLLRHCVGYLLSAIAGFLGFLWAIWDSKHQTWHDKLARTVVVLAR